MIKKRAENYSESTRLTLDAFSRASLIFSCKIAILFPKSPILLASSSVCRFTFSMWSTAVLTSVLASRTKNG